MVRGTKQVIPPGATSVAQPYKAKAIFSPWDPSFPITWVTTTEGEWRVGHWDRVCPGYRYERFGARMPLQLCLPLVAAGEEEVAAHLDGLARCVLGLAGSRS